MDCHAICTASSYQIKPLYRSLKSRYETTLYRDVIHIQVPQEEKENLDIFFFPYGAAICWGTWTRLPEEIENFQEQPLAETETENFFYSYGTELKILDDEIILPDRDILTKLSASHGLAQSVKLGAFEDTIAEAFKITRRIPEDLARRGKISLSRKEIRKKMGELFINRSSINLHVDVLDTPEFFWEYPELEHLYKIIANELEIGTRGHVLNQRLDVVRELFEMLGNELNHQHSSRLEWTIIWLIVIEVAITLLTHYHIV
jgi:uncharacterized Rmd1/YagE family protein